NPKGTHSFSSSLNHQPPHPPPYPFSGDNRHHLLVAAASLSLPDASLSFSHPSSPTRTSSSSRRGPPVIVEATSKWHSAALSIFSLLLASLLSLSGECRQLQRPAAPGSNQHRRNSGQQLEEQQQRAKQNSGGI
ncbi:hypothetical protein AABB24_007582, partial [Solanum stoloniferum]